MCGIAGLYHHKAEETTSILVELLQAIQHRGPDGAGLAVGSDIKRAWSLKNIITDNLKGKVGLGHVRLAIVGGHYGLQPFHDEETGLTLLHNGEIYNHHEHRKNFSSSDDLETQTDSEIVFKLLLKEYKSSHNYYIHDIVEKILPKLDGVYAIAVSDGKQLCLARDPIGVRQLYLVQNNGTTAFASEKKALESVGFARNIQRLKPGHLAWVEKNQWFQKPYYRLPDRETRRDITNFDLALEKYSEVIKSAVNKRLHDRNRVGIIYSGGVDSVLITQLVREENVEYACYTSGVKGSEDLLAAEESANLMDLRLEKAELTSDQIERMLPDIMRVIEDRSLNQVEVSVPIYSAVQLASKANERVLFTGQGADELFGGYPWYFKIVEKEGYLKFLEYSVSDIKLLYKETLEREDKITMDSSIELRVPFLDLEVIHTSLRMVPQLMIWPKNEDMGKRVHRRLAEKIGVPAKLAWRPKMAAQHGAGIHDTLNQLALKRGFTPEVIEEVGYSAKVSIPEVLGSSSRYGYRYASTDDWGLSDHIQCYLDYIALENCVISKSENLRLLTLLEPILSNTNIPTIST